MGAYGNKMGAHFRLRSSPTVISRVSHTTMAVTELRCDAPDWGMTTKIEPEDAFIVALQFGDYSGDLWLDGKESNFVPINRGQIAIYDLKMDTRAYLRTPFHCLQIYFPTTGLSNLLEETNGVFNRDLNCPIGTALDDPTWMQLAPLITPALQAPMQANQLFLDHLSLALGAHFVKRYSGVNSPHQIVCGGLAPWQLRIAKELISSRLDGAIRLSEMAEACGLTTTYFSRAFKKSTGLPPHQWLLGRRVEQAETYMLATSMTLMEIALSCGFSDQSHFIRVFTRFHGKTPSAWRREKSARRLQNNE